MSDEPRVFSTWVRSINTENPPGGSRWAGLSLERSSSDASEFFRHHSPAGHWESPAQSCSCWSSRSDGKAARRNRPQPDHSTRGPHTFRHTAELTNNRATPTNEGILPGLCLNSLVQRDNAAFTCASRYFCSCSSVSGWSVILIVTFSSSPVNLNGTL